MLVVGVLVGCATAPESRFDQVPVAVPSQWSVSPGRTAPVAAGWLGDFESDILPQLVEAALQQNYDLRATAARLAIARADAVVAGASLSPQVALGVDGARQKTRLSARGLGSVGPPSTLFTNYSLGLNLSWELDVWGRLRDQQAAALADVQVAEATVMGAQLSLVANVCKTWFTLLQVQQQSVLSEETIQSFRLTESVIRQRYERGVSDALDLRLIRSQLASAQANASQLQLQLDAAKRDLQVLIGAYPESAIPWHMAEFPAITQDVPAGLPAAMLQRRPDLRVAERRLAAAQQRVGEARKALLPAIRLTGSYGTTSDALSDLVDNNLSIWNLAGNLAQPILQGGRLRAGVARAYAVAEQRLQEYGQAALTAFKEVEHALAADVYVRERLMHLQVTVDELRAAETLAWERYQKGLTDIITVLDTQRRAFEASSLRISVEAQHLINRVQLYLALGGSFELNDASPKLETQ